MANSFPGVMAPPTRLSVRVSSILTAVVVVFTCGYLSHCHDNALHKRQHLSENGATADVNSPYTRHLLSNGYPEDSDYDYRVESSRSNDDIYDESSKVNASGCHSPLNPPAEYHGSSCQYVRDHCSRQTALINYLSFIMCDLGHLKVWREHCSMIVVCV